MLAVAYEFAEFFADSVLLSSGTIGRNRRSSGGNAMDFRFLIR